MGQPGTQASR